jgi:hypothetical protein
MLACNALLAIFKDIRDNYAITKDICTYIARVICAVCRTNKSYYKEANKLSNNTKRVKVKHNPIS